MPKPYKNRRKGDARDKPTTAEKIGNILDNAAARPRRKRRLDPHLVAAAGAAMIAGAAMVAGTSGYFLGRTAHPITAQQYLALDALARQACPAADRHTHLNRLAVRIAGAGILALPASRFPDLAIAAADRRRC